MPRSVVLVALVALAALAAAPAAVRAARHAWVLLEDTEAAVADAIRRGAEYGLEEVQLSHQIIMDIDDINSDPARAARIRGYVDMAHAANMTAVVWAHEFNGVDLRDICFDPAAPMWEARREAYRAALTAVPDVDGVVLMYGSSSIEPWYAVCLCDFCMNNDTVPRALRPFVIPSKVERIEQITRMVHGVVVGEFGKKLILRNFIHRPSELQWMQEAVVNMKDIVFEAMSKDVPQDFEPYYPPDPLFGYAPHTHIMEVDVAGEYWGKSILPFFAPGYFQRRLRHAIPLGMTGYTARVSRYEDTAFETPNEGNLWALMRFMDDLEGTTAAQVTAEFVQRRYAVDPTTPAGAALMDALMLTYDIGRKMYYFLGFWALEKSSGLPDSLRSSDLLIGRSIALYDRDYDELFLELLRPTVQTLVDLRQEKDEALELSLRAQARLQEAAGALGANDAADLSYRLRHQELCTRVWREVAECVWAFKLHRQESHNGTEVARWIDAALTEMERLATVIEGELPAGRRFPCDPADVRQLTEDLRDDFPAAGDGARRDQLLVSPPTVTVLAPTALQLTYTTDRPCLLRVDYGAKVPVYGRVAYPDNGGAATREHKVVLEGLAPREWVVFRAVALDAAGSGKELTHGADFWAEPQ